MTVNWKQSTWFFLFNIVLSRTAWSASKDSKYNYLHLTIFFFCFFPTLTMFIINENSPLKILSSSCIFTPNINSNLYWLEWKFHWCIVQHVLNNRNGNRNGISCINQKFFKLYDQVQLQFSTLLHILMNISV